jgi:hypothetical protein
MTTKQVWMLDNDGFLIDVRLAEVKISLDPDENEVETILADYPYTTTYYRGGFIRAKWNGENWIEGATEEEIQEMNKPVPPSKIELIGKTLVEIEIRLLMGGL